MSAQSDHARATHSPKEVASRPAATTGVVEALHIARAAGAPVHAVRAVRARAGVGLEGDRYADGHGHFQDARVSRDLTLIEAETIEALARDHGIDLAAGETRRNVTTRGISLNELVGRRFWVGDVLCQGTRLCEPCRYLADLTGKPLLRALVHRGGVRADILCGGFVRRGDRIRVVDDGTDELACQGGARGPAGERASRSVTQVALISDIHGNGVALDAVLADLAGHPVEEVICLGDVAAGRPQPREVITRAAR